jgi:hypothetical protein
MYGNAGNLPPSSAIAEQVPNSAVLVLYAELFHAG